MTDNQIIIWRINGRGCLGVTGVEAEAFLNDLLTLDMATITADQVVPAILLTPQGRIIFDLLISRIPDGFRLECDEHRLDDLIKKLRLYRLRRDIALTLLDEPVLLWQFQIIWMDGSAIAVFRRSPLAVIMACRVLIKRSE